MPKALTIEKFSGKFENESRGCTVLITETAQSIRNLAVGGLYMFLATLPSDWDINIEHLMAHFNAAKNTMYKHINSLIELGLLTKETIREAGRFVRFIYRLHLHPQPFTKICEMVATSQNLRNGGENENPSPERPHTISQNTGNSNLRSIHIIENTNHTELKETNNTYEYPDTLYPKPDKPKETLSKALTTLQMVGNNPHAIPQNLIEEWISIRKKKRAPITPTVWKKLNDQISHCHCSPIEAFEEMISRGWLTVKPEWVNKNTSKNGFYDEHSNWVKDEGSL